MNFNHRRYLLKCMLMPYALPASSAVQASPVKYPPVLPRQLQFPRDFGAHPDFRTEWWYLTGWLGRGADAMGFQITFFRSRTLHSPDNPSRFAPHQLLFAHAALAIPDEGKLRHADIAGRFGSAGASFDTKDTKLSLLNWTLERTEDDRYLFFIPTDTFTLQLEAVAKQAPILRGNAGVSAKGPQSNFASFYYSRPQLSVSAQVEIKNKLSATNLSTRFNRTGTAWFDHEWSSSLLMSRAVGWDWIGINLLDGGSIMAFRMRDQFGNTLFSEWDQRDELGRRVNRHQQAIWEPVGRWNSSRSLANYPEGFLIRVAAEEYLLKTLMKDQEVDARKSTGGFYYEGAIEVTKSQRVGGRGYLEVTGYGLAVKL